MRRASLLTASLSALALYAPIAAAQSGHGGHHRAPATQTAPVPAPAEVQDPSCSPEHAAMGHCTPEPAKDAQPVQINPDKFSDPACPPEHAVMGHCIPRVRAPAPAKDDTADADGAVGTDLPPGDATAPPPPSDWYADRIFPKGEMEHSRHEMMKENGAQKIAFISIDTAEYQFRKGRDSIHWGGEAWYGGDINRITIKGEGEAVIGEGFEGGEAQLLYSRAIGPYFNAQMGVRQDFGPGPDRTHAVVGFEGLAPYWFEVEGALFLSDKGDLTARFEGEHDVRITQKLILQPSLEMDFAAQDVAESGIGAGLSELGLGLRLRYDIVKEFAPYVGVEWNRKIGRTARYARAVGEEPESTSLVIGIKAWF